MNKVRKFEALFDQVVHLIEPHADIAVPDYDIKFTYAIIKTQFNVNKKLRKACLDDHLTPELLEEIMREAYMEDWVHVVHSMREDQEDFKQLQHVFQKIAQIWHGDR